MRYGHFDDVRKEYVIDRPDTPRSWSNYLGSRLYGAIITNNAGGYAFQKTAKDGRLLRLRFNSVPMDQPGRYFYLRDRVSGDYWSASWQPVGKPLDEYQSTCRFGTSYAVIDSRYGDIRMETLYFVPLGQEFEYWRLRVTNEGASTRSLSVVSYCEFASDWNIFQDAFNLQYTAYTVGAEFKDDMVHLSVNPTLPTYPDDFTHADQGRRLWMTQLGGTVSGYELDREAFLGPYRGYHNPLAVESGLPTNSIAWGDNACGSIRTDIDLAPGESREILVMMGVGEAGVDGRRIVAEYGHLERVEQELSRLKEEWHGKLGHIYVETPDEDFNHMVNVWNQYNALITFAWSRACSLVYTGDGRDGFGFRDTVQDILAVVPAIPEEARERLELMLTGQESSGGARPEINPLTHRPGEMPPTDPTHFRADDCLWFFNTVPAYVAETGDVGFYDKVLPYADRGEDTVFGHLRRALEFNLKYVGKNGLPCGLHADWNDCIKLGFTGESLFVTFQVRFGLSVYAGIADAMGLSTEAGWARAELEKLDASIGKSAWDGEWFLRGIREDGYLFGSSTCEEGKIFINPQSWAVISGAATPGQGRTAMDSVERHLATEFGIPLCTPPFWKTDVNVMRARLLNPGTKENGGIFSQPQGWAVMADCILGEGDRAYRHYRAYMPAAYNDRAEIREIEPYVHCQSTHAPASPKFGKSRLPWLTGTASWSAYAATHYILGIRPEIDGLRIDPCLPSTWPQVTVRRFFRDKEFRILIRNGKKGKGVRSMTVNGQVVEGQVVPLSMMREENKVEVELG